MWDTDRADAPAAAEAAKCVKISRSDEKLNATLGKHRSSMKFNMQRVSLEVSSGHWEHTHSTLLSHTHSHTLYKQTMTLCSLISQSCWLSLVVCSLSVWKEARAKSSEQLPLIRIWAGKCIWYTFWDLIGLDCSWGCLMKLFAAL